MCFRTEHHYPIHIESTPTVHRLHEYSLDSRLSSSFRILVHCTRTCTRTCITCTTPGARSGTVVNWQLSLGVAHLTKRHFEALSGTSPARLPSRTHLLLCPSPVSHDDWDPPSLARFPLPLSYPVATLPTLPPKSEKLNLIPFHSTLSPNRLTISPSHSLLLPTPHSLLPTPRSATHPPAAHSASRGLAPNKRNHASMVACMLRLSSLSTCPPDF